MSRQARCMGTPWPALAGLLTLFVVSACSGPLLANEAASARPRPSLRATPARSPDPLPIVLPRDDAAHDHLTEWWYHTGHLVSDDERRFGFEFVVFRAERGRFPVSWAAHLAITDEAGGRFLYDERVEIGGQVDRAGAGPDDGFDLAIGAQAVPGTQVVPGAQAVPGGPAGAGTWAMSGALGRHHLDAAAGRAADGTAFGLALLLEDQGDVLLHDHDGWVDFGPSGGSYYYSRPRMAARGSLRLGGEIVPVSGTAWFDHQWGDFVSVGGGWDWFALNLEDGTDLTISVVRDTRGQPTLVYGTVRDGTGDRHVASEELRIEARGAWTSPHTGITWPAGWRIELPDEGLDILLDPTLPDQELDTRDSTGVIYWEGSQRVSGTRHGRPIGGEAYVELTGYVVEAGA